MKPEKDLVVFDIECDGLNPTKIHCFCWTDGEEFYHTDDPKRAKEVLSEAKYIVGHNIIMFDLPVLEKLWGIKVVAKIIDTLALSWYLSVERQRHGLESWGRDLGIDKPEIKDWVGLTYEEYVHRATEDVRINLLLWKEQSTYLSSLYGTTVPEKLPIISYLAFKLDCAREQERSRWKLDIDWCNAALAKLEAEQEPRIATLKRAMPIVEKKVLKQPPPKPYKKDGTLSVEGAKWQKYCLEQGLTKTHSRPIYIVQKEEEPNPNSPDQIKDWLFSLGWEPITFKFIKEDDGTERKIPQTKLPNSPDICPSVLELAEKEPAIEALAGLSIVKHRLGVLKGFLENVSEDGFLKARIQGFTNTLRFKHTEIVNLPGVDKLYGEEMRGCLVAREGCILVGTDMVSLEDTTKKHYMWPHDPEYVKEMSTPGFDPHLDLAEKAKVVTKAQIEAFKAGDKTLTPIRKQYKVVNYSGVYGVGPPKLARELKSTVAFATQLLKSYWERNWSVKKIAEECVVKTVNGQKWLFNPVSKFWYSLRAEKDRFSTLNQGTGVYCFDMFVREVLKQRKQLTGQFHDEICLEIPIGKEEAIKIILEKAIKTVNEKLKLNVTLGIDTHFGHRYSDIH